MPSTIPRYELPRRVGELDRAEQADEVDQVGVPNGGAGHAQGSTTERYLQAARTSYSDAAELAEARLFAG